MRALLRAWSHGARAYQRRVDRRTPAREELVRRFAPGRTFADIGCMWQVEGAMAFLAERSGARAVTGLDYMPPTEGFEEQIGRGSQVRFVQGDLHDSETLAEVGPHDVVWCWGVLYHSPYPMLTLERLRTITREFLILGTATLPPVPGLSQACVFFPGLSDKDRRAHAAAWPGRQGRFGLTNRFVPSYEYGNWWWGITPSALTAMLEAAGFSVVEQHGGPLRQTALAKPVATSSRAER